MNKTLSTLIGVSALATGLLTFAPSQAQAAACQVGGITSTSGFSLIISRVNSPPLGAYEKSKKELQYPAACGGVVYLAVQFVMGRHLEMIIILL